MTPKQENKLLKVVICELVELDIGVYPKAIKSGNPKIDYSERDDFKNGHNHAVMEHCKEMFELLEDIGVEVTDDDVLFK